MITTDNFRKHTSKNPVQRFLLDNFFNTLVSVIKDLGQYSSSERSESRSRFWTSQNDSFRQARTIKTIESILDVGCGEGFTLARIQEERIGTRLEGIEYLDTAIKIGKKIHPHITFTKGDIYKLPYKDDSFDLVLCTEVLEHLDDPKKALTELVRVSKKYLLLSVPNEPIFMASNFLRGKNWSRWGNDIEHINHWSSRSFHAFVTRSDLVQGPTLQVVVKKYPFPWTMLLLEKPNPDA